MSKSSDHPSLENIFHQRKQALWWITRRLVRRVFSHRRIIRTHCQIFKPRKQPLWRMIRDIFRPDLQRVGLTEWFGRIVRPWGIRIIRPPLKLFCFCFLTWIHFGLCFFLLPSAFLSFFACLELILSKCAWNLRPTLEWSSYSLRTPLNSSVMN